MKKLFQYGRGRLRWRNNALYMDFHVAGRRYRKIFGYAQTGTKYEREALEEKARNALGITVEAAERALFDRQYPTYRQLSEFYWDKNMAVKEYIVDDLCCRKSELKKLKFGVEHFGDRRVNAISTDDVKRFRMALRSKHPEWSNSYVNRIVDKVGQVFRFARAQEVWLYDQAPADERLKYGRVDMCVSLVNPRHGLPKLTEEYAEPLIPTFDEFKGFLEYLSEPPKMFAIIAAHTGLRKRNVIRLRWDQVDLVNKRIFINSHKGKGKLILAMHDDLHGIFMKQYRSYGPEKSEYVICKPDGQRFTDVPGWRDAQKRAGMPKFCFKNLRNMYCSWHVENGAEMGLIQRALGHTTISTTARFYNKAQAASTMLVQSQRSLLSAAGSA